MSIRLFFSVFTSSAFGTFSSRRRTFLVRYCYYVNPSFFSQFSPHPPSAPSPQGEGLFWSDFVLTSNRLSVCQSFHSSLFTLCHPERSRRALSSLFTPLAGPVRPSGFFLRTISNAQPGRTSLQLHFSLFTFHSSLFTFHSSLFSKE
jgi:hypothetical protein